MFLTICMIRKQHT